MSKIKESIESAPSSNQFPVIGIGASAGGLEAVTKFMHAVPAKSGMAYVFVQHLNPEHLSALPEILEKTANIPVTQITDNIHLEPDNLYIIPANKIVTAVDGVLKLAPLDDKHHKVKVIDLFFSSLAVVHQSYAVGVVLSGTLTDGTLGLQVIKAYGGITFAQEETSAAFDGMPKSAIRAGAVDFILPPEKIAAHLITINHPFHTLNPKKGSAREQPPHDEDIFKQILTVLRVRRGVDFNYYKPNTLKRRVIRRMALSGIKKPDEYLVLLRENKIECDALYNDFLISVTNFFRDPASFELLCSTVLPGLIKKKTGTQPLRIWVAGCATGEEAYSIAICLQEYLGDKAAAMKIQVFATDISEIAIAKARTGIYRPMDIEGVSPSRLQQFFTKFDGSYQINKVIREMCVFANHNLLKDPPFSNIDMVTCRNVLIYLEPVLQKKLLNTFHYSLNDQGFLVLGKSESVGDNTDLFSSYNSAAKIFLRKGARGRFMQVTTRDSEQNFKNIDKNTKQEDSHDIFKLADDIVLSRYAPAGVLVNERFDIVQFRGKTDRWLELSPGKASLNLLKLVREGLSFELRNLLHLAKKSKTEVSKNGIIFKTADEQAYVNIKVALVSTGVDPHYLVLFADDPQPDPPLPVPRSGQTGTDARDQQIDLLKKELMQARADMRSVTEEQEAANEELQSANEELLSGSEELQSLNEELETSKEELQSTNEEITIVNNELLDRNEQLNNARTYTEEIINTIRDPLIILDQELKVKRATEGFYKKFKVTEKETEGQYFYELGNGQWDMPALRNLLESIIPEKKVFTDFEVVNFFPKIGRRVIHINARQLDKVNGDQLILLALEDITSKRKIEEGLAEVERLFKDNKERLKLAVDAAGLCTWDYNTDTGELFWDIRCQELFGLPHSQEDVYDKFINIIHPDDRLEIEHLIKQSQADPANGEFEKEFRTVLTADKKLKWIKIKGKAYFDDAGVAHRIVGTFMDVTVQKMHEDTMAELLKQKDDFISIASHELKTPITSLKAALQLIDRMKNTPAHHMLPNLVDLANKSLDKVTVLVEDLLNASKSTQGQLHISKNYITLSKVVNDCCYYIHMDGIYSIITEGDLELKVNADPERISQVVVNFINNAIKYAPESKEIHVHIEKEHDCAKVSVTDSGPGIPPEQLPHLFERYYRVGKTGKQISGLGLGLYISSEIIKKHGGQIGVESEMGKGSTFWFKLPL